MTVIHMYDQGYLKLDLNINLRKILYQPSPRDLNLKTPSVPLNEEALENVNHFRILEATLSSNAVIDDQIQY